MKNLPDEEITRLSGDSDDTVRLLAAEVARLRAGIKSHRSATGHELCWLNDVELWKLVEDNPAYPHETLPVQDEFLSQCRRYHESRLKNSPYAEPQARATVKKTK